MFLLSSISGAKCYPNGTHCFGTVGLVEIFIILGFVTFESEENLRFKIVMLMQKGKKNRKKYLILFTKTHCLKELPTPARRQSRGAAYFLPNSSLMSV